MILYLNGRFIERDDAGIDPLERGFLLGHGAFETLRAEEGQPLHFGAHAARLASSLLFLRMQQGPGEGELREICEQVLDANGLEFARIRITVAAGASDGSPRAVDAQSPPTVLVYALALARDACRQLPLPECLSIASFPLNERSPLAAAKCTGYSERLLARAEAIAGGAEDALLLNTQGRVAEAAMANVFVVRADGVLATPPTAEGALGGVMRAQILSIARELGFESAEAPVTLRDLEDAREVLLTNVIRQVVPVRAVGGWRMSATAPGPMAKGLHAAYRIRVAGEIESLRGE